MILVAFLRVMPGITFLRTTTTLGIVFSQSLCKITFQGRSGLASLPVRVLSALLIFVALILGTILPPSTTLRHGSHSQKWVEDPAAPVAPPDKRRGGYKT